MSVTLTAINPGILKANADIQAKSHGRYGLFDAPWRPEGGFAVEHWEKEFIDATCWWGQRNSLSTPEDVRATLIGAEYYAGKYRWEKSHRIPCAFNPKDTTATSMSTLSAQASSSSVAKKADFLKEHKVAVILVSAAVLTIAAVALSYYVFEKMDAKITFADRFSGDEVTGYGLRPLKRDIIHQHNPDLGKGTSILFTNTISAPHTVETKKAPESFDAERIETRYEEAPEEEMDAFDLVKNLVFLRSDTAETKQSPPTDTEEELLWDDWTTYTTYVEDARGKPSTIKALHGIDYVMENLV